MGRVITTRCVHRLRPAPALLAVLLWLAIAPPSATAQRLFGVLDRTVVELGTAPPQFGRPVNLTTLPTCDPGPVSRFWPVEYGRYLAWSGFDRLCLFDMVAGRLRTIPMPPYTSIAAAATDTFALVLHDDTTVWTLGDPAGTPLSVPVSAAGYPPKLAIASASREVVSFQRVANAASTEAVIVNLDSGALIRRVPMPDAEAYATNASATRFAAVQFDYLGSAVATLDGGGAVLRALAPVDMPYPYSAERSLVFVGDTELRVQTHAGLARLDANTLTTTNLIDVGRPWFAPTPGWSRQVGVETFDEQPARAYFIEQEWHDYSYSRHDLKRITLSAVDLTTSRTTTSFDLLAAYGTTPYNARFFLIPPPPSPRQLTAVTAPGRVALTWAAAPGATHYRLEAGTGPGLANIAAFDLGAPSFVAIGIPRGRYYVRVRAAGVGGLGLRSGDVVVDVP